MKKSNLFFPIVLGLLFWSISGFSQNSVLSSGDWYKISTDHNGIFKIGYDDLVSYGIDPTTINPKNIRIYGNGNGMLPEENSEFRYDDLRENAIFVSGEDDGSFDPEDYILFYGEGQIEWKLNEEPSLFEHQTNYYSDYTYYFLTTDLGEGKRIQAQEQSTQPATFSKTDFDNYYVKEDESVNLLKSGRTWYGDSIKGNNSINYDISLPGTLVSSQAELIVDIAARTFENGLIKIYIDDAEIKQFTILPINYTSVVFARDKTDSATFTIPANSFNIKIEFISADTTTAWLNYFTINYNKALSYENGAFAFRCADVTGNGNVTQFNISNVPQDIILWNVTDPLNVANMDFDLNSSELTFKTETDNLLEFYAFSTNETATPEFIEQVPNQNLHALEPVGLIIVTYYGFMNAAQQLAVFHQENDNISSVVVTPEQVFNEFSSGAQDVTAIRDFVKYIYDKASNDNKPEYLLLIGKASYDYKDRIDNNTNLVPVWEAENSLNRVAAFGTDDFFGWLDNDEGTSGVVDIGIGRIPVLTESDAQSYIDKIFHYSTSEATLGNWKNELCFVADDGDNNLHLIQADSLTNIIPMDSNPFNTTKTYLDFFELVSTPEGPRYPDVNQSINSQIEEGRFLMNFTGHGGNDSWAHELVLTKEQIESWTNINKLPVFIIASCCFAGFDNPEIEAGGTLLLENENGGGIAIFSPVKYAYSSMNFSFNNALIEFFADDGQNRTLGNMQKNAKEAIGNSSVGRVWNLLGDPALKLAFPEFSIQTETINGITVTEPLDTINPGDQVTITGSISDDDGNQLTDFNGDIFIKVFYKQFVRTTNGNTNQTPVVDINVQDSVMLETTATVTNGEFEAQFTVPDNLDQDYGYLKLSYYATSGATDATGYFANLLAGGEPNVVVELNSEDLFKVYPTYADDYVSIIATQNSDNVQVAIYDLTGKPVVGVDNSVLTKKQEIKIDVSDLTKGLYILQIRSTAGISSYKIIKR